MAISYSVTTSWIEDVLRAGGRSQLVGELRLPLHAEAFSAVLPLMRHGALVGEKVPAPEPSLTGQLAEAFQNVRVKRFVANARNLAGDRSLAIRNNAVYLRTQNALTSRFIPPGAHHVDAALEVALNSIAEALARHHGDSSRTAICALLGSQLLLTIHPFRDGNGRTARMFFAAQLLRHVGPAPTGLLGLILMQGAGVHQYHQACWAFRTGDVEPMVSLFVDSERAACDRLLRGSAFNLPHAALLAHCWEELRKLN